MNTIALVSVTVNQERLPWEIYQDKEVRQKIQPEIDLEPPISKQQKKKWERKRKKKQKPKPN